MVCKIFLVEKIASIRLVVIIISFLRKSPNGILMQLPDHIELRSVHWSIKTYCRIVYCRYFIEVGLIVSGRAQFYLGYFYQLVAIWTVFFNHFGFAVHVVQHWHEFFAFYNVREDNWWINLADKRASGPINALFGSDTFFSIGQSFLQRILLHDGVIFNNLNTLINLCFFIENNLFLLFKFRINQYLLCLRRM